MLVGIAAQYVHTNLATRALVSYLGDEHGFDLSVRDFTINQHVAYIYGELIRERPDVIFFSCYIWNRTLCDTLINRLKAACPELAVYVGGPEVSWQAADLLRAQPSWDGIMTGEGERAFQVFLSEWETGYPKFHRVPGLVWRSGAEVVENPLGSLLSMADLPLPYSGDMAEAKNRIVYYESSRGCPYRCAYCLSSLDKQVRERPLDRVFEDLSVFIDAGVMQVKFIDRTFNADAARALDIWQFIGNRDTGLTNFHFEVTADIMTDEALTFLKTLRPGLLQFEIGVQSTFQPTLEAVHRHMDMERLAEVVAALKAGGNIHLHLDLIAGLPYEDLASFRKSFNDVYALMPHALQLGFLKVLPGTELHARASDYGLRYDPQAPYEILATPHLSAEELCHLQDVEEVLNVYHNTGRFEHALGVVSGLSPSPFDTFEALAYAWRTLGLYGIHTGLRQQCDALRTTAMALPGYDESIFQSALAYDLYRREKPRRLPEWLPNFAVAERLTKTLLDTQEANAILSRHGLDPVQANVRQNLLAFFPKGQVPPEMTPGYTFFYYGKRDLNGNAVTVHLPL